MSAIAGDVAVQAGAHYLAKHAGGKGILLGQVRGVRSGKVVVVGDGTVGRHAARTALGLGAEVYLFTIGEDRIPALRAELGADCHFLVSSPAAIAEHVSNADLLVGAVLVRGAKAAKVVSEEMVRSMEAGSVIVDVSIDQGGCIATSRPTTYSDPVFVKHGVTHYCVANMPGAYPRTATMTLAGDTIPYILALAAKGLAALEGDPGLAKGVNVRNGKITYRAVAEALQMEAIYEALR
jgi:alanine dehydrogenase